MASISKRDKTWQARISYKNSDGKFRVKTDGGFPTKRAAQLYAAEVEANIANGIMPGEAKDSHVFAEYFNKWFEDFKKPKLSDRTQQRYLITYHELQNYFGNKNIESITRRSYQKFITDYGSSHAKDTVQKVNSLLRACVRNAIYEEVIYKDFTVDVELVFNAAKARKIEYLNTDEMHRLVNLLMKKQNTNFTSNQMILTAIYTGMRLGEIQGLKWEDINFNFNAISVNHAYNESTKEIIPTKTESSVRVVRVNQMLIDVLSELKDKAHSDFVFMNQYDTVPTSSAVNKQLRSLLKELKISRSGFHFHSLRHTHVAYLLSRGMDLYAISKRLGHADLGTTTRVYAYLIAEYKAKTDNQIENYLNDIMKPMPDTKVISK